MKKGQHLSCFLQKGGGTVTPVPPPVPWPMFKPLLYRRYVDDCFLLFRSLDHEPLFFFCVPKPPTSLPFSFHLNLKRAVNFLFSILKQLALTAIFSTSVYRKPTLTGLFTNFHSFDPLVYKSVFSLLFASSDFSPLLQL